MANWVEPHPWSEGFKWNDPTGPFLRLSAAEAASFGADGFLVLRGALDPTLIETVRSVVDELEKEREAELEAKGGREGISQQKAITFSSHLVAKSAVLEGFRQAPGLTPSCAATLSGPTSTCTGTRQFTRSLRTRGAFRGIKTMATLSWSRNSTSRVGHP